MAAGSATTSQQQQQPQQGVQQGRDRLPGLATAAAAAVAPSAAHGQESPAASSGCASAPLPTLHLGTLSSPCQLVSPVRLLSSPITGTPVTTGVRLGLSLTRSSTESSGGGALLLQNSCGINSLCQAMSGE
jgi:hypothetical protein